MAPVLTSGGAGASAFFADRNLLLLLEPWKSSKFKTLRDSDNLLSILGFSISFDRSADTKHSTSPLTTSTYFLADETRGNPLILFLLLIALNSAEFSTTEHFHGKNTTSLIAKDCKVFLKHRPLEHFWTLVISNPP